MSSGLFALLDDIAVIAKAAAATIDDTATQAAQASATAAGVVIDDAAVTPRYVTGFSAERELPVIGRIALGSVKNKIFYLLPAALALSYFAPFAITPILMLGAIYLCYEGFEKVHELAAPHNSSKPERASAAGAAPASLENDMVASAIRTDFILSAEIMAITLASIASPDIVTKAIVLALAGLFVTAGVYGLVALLVKADDLGLHLARTSKSSRVQGLGRALVTGMPRVLSSLSFVGIAAMLWVGGGILLHGSEVFGFGGPSHAINDVAHTIGRMLGPLEPLGRWTVEAAAAGTLGLAIGATATVASGLMQRAATILQRGRC